MEEINAIISVFTESEIGFQMFVGIILAVVWGLSPMGVCGLDG
jgi:hypothetical protein|tara:strand:+ start:253 stop:381 length:129 start_codon:yes stop_codon:yes gene_type:complete